MIYLNDDLFDLELLRKMIREGYVQVRTHPKYSYNIYCYTKKAMFDREWNEVTRTCRGLIVDRKDFSIIARPFKKFFNHGEPNAPEYGPDDFVEVWDKMDGSLGILYTAPDGLNVATKGSFASYQAKWATAYFRAQYGLTEWRPADNHTYLFEIVYPENRIVLDYGATQGLFLLGVMDIESGLTVDVDPYSHPFPTTEFIMEGKYAETYHALSKNGFLRRTNREGVVVRRLKDDERLKFKQEDYIQLHRVMTGLNERQIWEWFGAEDNKTLDDYLLDLPEELHEWVTNVWKSIRSEFDDLLFAVDEAYYQAESGMCGRKEFALAIQEHPNWLKGALFARYDGNIDRVTEIVWKQVKP